MSYSWLFFVNAYISAFTFGGGYVVIPMIQKFYVEKHSLFTQHDVMDMAAIAQSSPGAIAINLAVLAGYRVHGFKGALTACIGAILPPLIIISILSVCYHQVQDNVMLRTILKGMEAGAVTLIIDLLITMSTQLFHEQSKRLFILLPATFLLCAVFQLSIPFVIFCGLGAALLFRKRGT